MAKIIGSISERRVYSEILMLLRVLNLRSFEKGLRFLNDIVMIV